MIVLASTRLVTDNVYDDLEVSENSLYIYNILKPWSIVSHRSKNEIFLVGYTKRGHIG